MPDLYVRTHQTHPEVRHTYLLHLIQRGILDRAIMVEEWRRTKGKQTRPQRVVSGTGETPSDGAGGQRNSPNRSTAPTRLRFGPRASGVAALCSLSNGCRRETPPGTEGGSRELAPQAVAKKGPCRIFGRHAGCEGHLNPKPGKANCCYWPSEQARVDRASPHRVGCVGGNGLRRR